MIKTFSLKTFLTNTCLLNLTSVCIYFSSFGFNVLMQARMGFHTIVISRRIWGLLPLALLLNFLSFRAYHLFSPFLIRSNGMATFPERKDSSVSPYHCDNFSSCNTHLKILLYGLYPHRIPWSLRYCWCPSRWTWRSCSIAASGFCILFEFEVERCQVPPHRTGRSYRPDLQRLVRWLWILWLSSGRRLLCCGMSGAISG